MRNKYKRVDDRYVVKWVIPIENTTVYLGSVSSDEEAKILLNKVQFEFYSRNPRLLPKAITIRRDTKTFMVGFINPYTKKTTTFGQFYKTLEEAEDVKWKILKSLVG